MIREGFPLVLGDKDHFRQNPGHHSMSPHRDTEPLRLVSDRTQWPGSRDAFQGEVLGDPSLPAAFSWAGVADFSGAGGEVLAGSAGAAFGWESAGVGAGRPGLADVAGTGVGVVEPGLPTEIAPAFPGSEPVRLGGTGFPIFWR